MPAHKPPHPLLDLPDMTPDLNPDLATERLQARERDRIMKHGKLMDGWPRGCRIIVDRREKLPFQGLPNSERGTLATGDYGLKGLPMVAIERKSLKDCFHTLSTPRNRARFERELVRGKDLKFFAVVLECSVDTIINHPPPRQGSQRREYDGPATWRRLVRLSVKHCCPVWPCVDKAEARRVTLRLLYEAYGLYWREMET